MKKSLLKIAIVVAVVLLVGVIALAMWWRSGPKPGEVLDEARIANRAASSFPAADEDYFRDMDDRAVLTPDEVKGRNTWNVWTGGNDRFWDEITVKSFGAVDFLKTISSYPNAMSSDPNNKMKFSRDNRWQYLGLVNEPCFEKPTAPDPERFGLWLDKRTADCPPDPFENEAKYPGVQIGHRGKALPAGKYTPKDGRLPVGSYYGYATGIVGLRLFPNPEFDEAAASKWDAERFYNDPSYYNSKDLVRPYRVGMSCGFCHVGPNPVKPPADPERPKWENLSSNVGAQYFWVDRIFDWQADESSFIFQLFHTSRPGTLDTSLVSTDNINNPRSMNALYHLGSRLELAGRFGKETLADGGSGLNKQFNDYPTTAALASLFNPPATSYSPRVLKDGADSVGGLGALNRVYLNIGLFSEEWLLHFNPLVGGKKTTPIKISDARKNSSYWEATEAQTPAMALFFLKTTAPHKLEAAPDGNSYLSKDKAVLERGKTVFAENCARCHSSKLPAPDTPKKIYNAQGCAGKDYLQCWEEYWQWTKTDEFKSKMRAIAAAPDFLDANYLSTEFRVPVTLLKTNACSPLATNAIRNNIWDNFSSDTYKDLPSVGTIKVYNPATGAESDFKMPGGGRGYTRPPSLISMWSTAPFLLNNTVGKFNSSPSISARMDSFTDSIEQMLLLKKRDQDTILGDKVPGKIDRTTKTSYIVVKSGYLPDLLSGLVGWGDWFFPSFYGKCSERTDLERGDICLGPIPRDTAIGLLSNLDARPDEEGIVDRIARDRKLLNVLHKIRDDLKALGNNASDEEARKVFLNLVEPLMELSKCPDYVVNSGHYFGTGYDGEPALSDEDKRALIEFLKTL
ncbi:MAG TPA: hypothetical protein VK363_05680 [Pyrinomonadaceae bacterium]|nr:hypothetical protein [Pyrinomonadaceae bacterium]